MLTLNICYIPSCAQEYLDQDLHLSPCILLSNVEINSLERTEGLRVNSHGRDQEGGETGDCGGFLFSNYMAFSDFKFLKNAVRVLL